MLHPDRDVSYLLDMLTHAQGVVRSVEGRTFLEYVEDEDLRMAVERRVEIIGEAARRISSVFREAHPEIPWRKIISQRNILAHEYGEIEDEILWRVATVSIPELIARLEPLVPAAPNTDE